MEGLDRSGHFRMGMVVNTVLSVLKASSIAMSHARCLDTIFKRGIMGIAMLLKPQINLQ